MDSNYSLADIRAATHDDDGYGGQGSWFWIVVLFLFMFGFGQLAVALIEFVAALG